MTTTVENSIEEQQTLSIVFNGHVDHGKSTLVGRLLADLGLVQPARIASVEAICKEKNMKFEYAFLLDAFEEEQDQGITIDVSQVRFRSKKRPYRIIDAPGHKEFLKNMISGASTADVSILMIDAEEGVREQSHRHATILSLLGIKTIIVVVNKMDLMDYKQDVFENIKTQYSKHLASLKLAPHAFIPMAAYVGENVVKRSDKMPWYTGKSFLETLDALETPALSEERPLRFPLQDVYKFDKKRVYAGRIESGALEAGQEILLLPSGTKTRVRSIEKWHAPAQTRAAVGESIGVTLDDPVFAERGEMIVHAASAPQVGTSFIANIFWMGSEHVERGAKYTLKITTEEVECVVDSILKVVNSSTLEEVAGTSKVVAKNEVAEVILRMKKPLAFDSFDEITATGRFVLAAKQQILGGGIILKQMVPFSAI